MKPKRTARLNSLLQEVISEVISKDLRNPKISPFVSVTKVDITQDLHFAKVSISVIGTPLEKETTILALQSAAGFIAVHSSKKMTIRYFPALTFVLDTSVENHINMEKVLADLKKERESREASDESTTTE